MRRYTLCLGQQAGYKHPAPERTAKKSGAGIFDDDIFQVWPNRASMARSIRMQERGLQQTATGYGSKLTTPYKILFCGKQYRIYATCHSNVASCWFVTKGRKIHVD